MYRAAWLRIIKYDLNMFTEVVMTCSCKYSECLSVSVSRRRTDECVLSFRGAARRDPASRVFNQHAVRADVGVTAALRRPPQSGERHWATVGPHPATRTSRQTWGTWRRVSGLETDQWSGLIKAATNDYFHCDQSESDFQDSSVHCLIFKMSGYCEMSSSQFPRAQRKWIQTVQNQKTLYLLS